MSGGVRHGCSESIAMSYKYLDTVMSRPLLVLEAKLERQWFLALANK